MIGLFCIKSIRSKSRKRRFLLLRMVAMIDNHCNDHPIIVSCCVYISLYIELHFTLFSMVTLCSLGNIGGFIKSITDKDFLFVAAFDIYTMAVQANSQKLYAAAVAFFEVLVNQTIEEEKIGRIHYPYLWDFKMNSLQAKSLLKASKKVHDDQLTKMGQYGVLQRCNQHPFTPKNKKKNRYRTPSNFTPILDRTTLAYYSLFINKQTAMETNLNIATHVQTEKLCRGDQLRVSPSSCSSLYIQIIT